MNSKLIELEMRRPLKEALVPEFRAGSAIELKSPPTVSPVSFTGYVLGSYQDPEGRMVRTLITSPNGPRVEDVNLDNSGWKLVPGELFPRDVYKDLASYGHDYNLEDRVFHPRRGDPKVAGMYTSLIVA